MLVSSVQANQSMEKAGVFGHKKNTSNSGVQNDIREEFYQEFDKWVADGKIDANVRFVIGNTSDVLKLIGVKNQEIILRSGTVIQKLKDHKEMTTELFKKIPELLEHPIIVQFSDGLDANSGRPKYDSRISVLGELYADVIENGIKIKKPVLVSLELLPTNQKGSTILDFSIITSAYAKNSLQHYLSENSILYIEPNKKKTNAWLSLNRLQLPLGETNYGLIRSITYIGEKVKIQNSINKTSLQIALEKAGLVNESGVVQNSDRDDDISVHELMGEKDRLTKENEAFKAEVERLKERLKLERQLTHGNHFNESSLNTVAAVLLKRADSTLDKVEFAKWLRNYYATAPKNQTPMQKLHKLSRTIFIFKKLLKTPLVLRVEFCLML